MTSAHSHVCRKCGEVCVSTKELDETRHLLEVARVDVTLGAKRVARKDRLLSDLFEAMSDWRAIAERLAGALRIQDPRNATERYELIADAFKRETSYWPPGRSRPAEMGTDPTDPAFVQKKWREFCNEWHERFFDTALAEFNQARGGGTEG